MINCIKFESVKSTISWNISFMSWLINYSALIYNFPNQLLGFTKEFICEGERTGFPG